MTEQGAGLVAERGGARWARLPVEIVAVGCIVLIVLLPLIDLTLSRLFWRGIPVAGPIVDHAVFALAFLAAALASLDRRHLALGRPAQRGWRLAAGAAAQLLAVTVQTALFWAALSLSFTGFDPSDHVWILPTWLLSLAMPLGFVLMAAFTIYRAGRFDPRNVSGMDKAAELGPAMRRTITAAAALGLVLGSLLAVSSIRNLAPSILGSSPAILDRLADAVQNFVHAGILPLGILMVVGALFGAPIFTVLGGLAVILFVGAGSYIALASSEAYNLLRGSSISALPLFGIAGLLLAESGAGGRLVAVFREFFGWVRGGEAIVAVLACGFFSTFTGVNGVTILALGGLLVGVLVQSGGFREGAARGLVTASGDIGLLLPPSAAVIVYGINAQFIYGDASAFDVTALFRGALLPGALLVGAMCVAGVLAAPRRAPGERRHFHADSAWAALKPALLELIVPLLAVLLFFTGFASLREIGAFCVLYIAVVESLIKRELSFRGLFGVLRRALPVIGGTLVVIAAARGLSFYIIDANVPAAFTGWIQSRVTSPVVFLAALNLFLLLVGCLMDIFSAILVVSPFVIPLGAAFGIDPVHFGVIFIMNLCIGFLTPTIGMNIFLASYAFRKPIAEVVKEVWPYLLVQIAVLLVITYVPGLTALAH
ncbi:MAG TPA: TRAP transporter large permease [Rectinemataceae bacterium]|nr:TRAP transporter large permease [Rectinemataceae bacterium]